MSDRWTGQVAVLADPHVHDTRSGFAYGLAENGCFRSLAESAASTRVYNEGGAAFVRALDMLVERGVRLTMIAGDLTDDGQAPNWRASTKLLDQYSRTHGMRFFLTPGNHDQWHGDGKVLRKQMVQSDGTTFFLSGDNADANALHAAEMRQIGQEEMLTRAKGFGLCRHRDDVHWETPFGSSDAFADRMGAIGRPDMDDVQVPDFSYLVEPVSGLWILSVDANVYLPDAAGWRDFGTEGWIAVLRHKAWLLDWMQDVARRARASGKQLLTMSHFPAFDVLNGVSGGLSKRIMPTPEVSDAIAATQIGLHFSGHWHINRTGGQSGGDLWLVNVAVPSTSSFPAAFKLVDLADQKARIETVRLENVPGFDAGFGHYKAEQPANDLAQTESYDEFLVRHLHGLTGQRYLARDWPPEFSRKIESATLLDVLGWAGANGPEDARTIPARLAVTDYYFLERGGELARIPADRLSVYKSLGTNEAGGEESASRLALGLARYSQAMPDDCFTLDLTNGRVARPGE